MSQYNVKIRYTSNYHAQANPSERVNRVFKTAISCFVEDNQRKWNSLLPKVAAAIRSSKHEATNNSPYFVNFGSEMNLDGATSNFKDDLDGNIEIDQQVESNKRVDGFKDLRADVKKLLAKCADNDNDNEIKMR